jgi:hypothetical protein
MGKAGPGPGRLRYRYNNYILVVKSISNDPAGLIINRIPEDRALCESDVPFYVEGIHYVLPGNLFRVEDFRTDPLQVKKFEEENIIATYRYTPVCGSSSSSVSSSSSGSSSLSSSSSSQSSSSSSLGLITLDSMDLDKLDGELTLEVLDLLMLE